MRCDESLQILANAVHHCCVALHARQQHATFQRRDDEAREPRRVDVVLQLNAQLPEQRLQLSRPLVEHLIEPPAKSLMRIRKLPGEIAERRAIPSIAFPLQRHHRVDEEHQPVERLDHRLSQNGQPPLDKP